LPRSLLRRPKSPSGGINGRSIVRSTGLRVYPERQGKRRPQRDEPGSDHSEGILPSESEKGFEKEKDEETNSRKEIIDSKRDTKE